MLYKPTHTPCVYVESIICWSSYNNKNNYNNTWNKERYTVKWRWAYNTSTLIPELGAEVGGWAYNTYSTVMCKGALCYMYMYIHVHVAILQLSSKLLVSRHSSLMCPLSSNFWRENCCIAACTLTLLLLKANICMHLAKFRFWKNLQVQSLRWSIGQVLTLYRP